MALVDTCCCGCSLRAGVILIAILQFACATGLGIELGLETDELTIETYVAIGILSLLAVLCILLIIGAWLKFVPVLRVAAFLQFIFTACIMLGAVLALREEWWVGGTTYLLVTVICFYFFIVITSFATEIVELRIATDKKTKSPSN